MSSAGAVDMNTLVIEPVDQQRFKVNITRRERKWLIKYAPYAVVTLATKALNEGLSPTVVSPARTVVNANADALMNRSRQNDMPP
jgi:hypothetical protein